MSGVNEIRSTFLNFFAENGHEIVPSSPLVPRNDPTLMFTNAGMVQFKNVFTGVEKRPYQRATTSQKCVRAGGKHNDLDNVGYTARHLTFFEMLGNFSFGDYFKERAIELAWTLITKDFGLKKDKLLVTIYHDDDEAAGHWKKIAGLPDDRIIRIATSDNFWAMGDTGPCGPCSEIFIDRGEHIWGGPPGSPEEDGDRFLEFWNLVFMQFEQVTKEERQPLPRPSIDTGMGLERMAGHPAGRRQRVRDRSVPSSDRRHGVRSRAWTEGSRPSASFRVIADHLRSSAFLIADGVLPSNEGRGYVLRRIMRRAMRHAQLLGAEQPLMHRLVWALVREMGQAYPDLVRAEKLIEETLQLEETRFRKTLARGLSILDEKSAALKKGDMFDGDTAFTLYDTYGFPLDLTQDALKSRGIGVDIAAFTDAMDRQREKARASWAGSGETATESDLVSAARETRRHRIPGLRDRERRRRGHGAGQGRQGGRQPQGRRDWKYCSQPDAVLCGVRRPGRRHRRAQRRGRRQVPRHGYAKEGRRSLRAPRHAGAGHAEARRGAAARGRSRAARHIRRHHSGTHLLHEALRQVLGDHIAQRGSLVAPDRLRFDFAHPKPISAEELARVEEIANDVVLENDEVTTRLMALDDAREAGARALFGEKYGDEVRVVSMGNRSREQGQNAMGWSVELCGGTHVKRTGDVGLISVTSESAVASGVRRIEALTGRHARKHANDVMALAKSAAAELRTTPEDVPARITALMDERKKLERELSDARKKLAMGGGASAGNGAAASGVREVGNVKLMARAVEGIEMKDLKSLADDGKKQLGSGVVAIVGVTEDGKAGVVVGVTPDLTARFNAVNLVRVASEALGGKGGGGRPDMAQAGGPDGAKANAALDAIAAAMAAA